MDAKKIKFSIYMISVLISLYSAYYYGKNNLIASMVTAIIILGIGGYYIIEKQKNDSFMLAKDIFVLMWIALYLVLPAGGNLVADNIEDTVRRLGYVFIPSNTLVLYYTGALILLVLIGKRWKETLVYRTGLYIIVSLIATPLFQILFGVDTSFIVFTAISAILCELISKNRFQYKPIFKKFLLFYISLFVVLTLYPDRGLAGRIQNLFYLGDIWPYVTIVLLICGVICILENYQSIRNLPQGEMTESFVTGCALICMALYIFQGKAWPQFFNIFIVYIAVPASILLVNYADKHMISSNIKLFIWIGIMFGLPAAGRTLNENSLFYFVIIAIFIVRFILLKMDWKNYGVTIIMQEFWGVAAAVLLFCSKKEIFDMTVIRTHTFSLITLIGSGVLWVILIHNTYSFDKQLRKGKYSKDDYKMIPRLQMIGIYLVMLMTLFRLLF